LSDISEAIDLIEQTIGRTVRRDISGLTAFAKGQLAGAARSLATTPDAHVGIVVGFFVRHAEPPSPETDGLNGMGQLAIGLMEAGFKVTVISDAPCAKAVWAVIDALPGRPDLEIVDVNERSVRRLRDHLTHGPTPLTHLIAIERVSPGADGRPHREHGWDMSRETAPLHLLFQDTGWSPPWTTVGIGDGGNEIGMGVLPSEVIARYIPNGSLIAATTPADFLIVAGVSNWGAYGLLAAVAALLPDRAGLLLRYFTSEMECTLLAAAGNIGQAIDDSRADRPGKLQMSVDRIPVEEHGRLIETLAAMVRSGFAALTRDEVRA